MPGSSTYASDERPDRAAVPPRVQVVQTVAAPWRATVQYPGSVRIGSQEYLVVEVTGPIALNEATVDIGVEPREGGRRRWESAVWQEIAGTLGVCATLLGVGNLRLDAGWYRVLVRPAVAGQRPILQAGQLIVE